MALTDADLEGLEVTTERKPVGGVTEAAIPEALNKLLTEHAPKALADKDYELILKTGNAKVTKQLALYARAWGARQTPKLYIHKVPNRKDMPDTTARLAVELDEDVSADNRPGRKAAK